VTSRIAYFLVLLHGAALATAAATPATLACQTDYNTNTHGHRVHTRYVSALFTSDRDPAQLAAEWKAVLAKTYGLAEPFAAKCAPLTSQRFDSMVKQVERGNGVVVQVQWQP
jgi:septal ring-binding cell division protein DamX